VLASARLLPAKERPPACPGGAFVVAAGTPVVKQGEPQQTAPDFVAVGTSEDAGAQAAIASACPQVSAKIRARRRGTTVSAVWPKGTCQGTSGRVRLRGRILSDCEVLRGTVSGKGFRRRFTAQRHDGNVSATTDDARAATALVSADAGGSVTTTAADGAVYTLTVPPGALLEDIQITVTPVVALDDLPIAGDLAAGVRFAPEGLQFFTPATLTVDLPAPVSGSVLAGFGAEGGGERFHLDLVEGVGTRFIMPVRHFSLVGVISLSLAAITAETAIAGVVVGGLWAGDPEVQGLNELFQLLNQNNQERQKYVNVFRKWYDTTSLAIAIEHQGVGRALFLYAPASDEDLRKALRGYVVWKQAIDATSSLTGLDLASDLFSRLTQAQSYASTAVGTRIERANQACSTDNVPGCSLPGDQCRLARAHDVMRFQKTAEKLGLILPGSHLDLASVLAALCVQAQITELTPQSLGNPIPGSSGPLELRAGRAFTAEPVVYGPNVQVTVDATGVASPVQGGPTNAQGYFNTSYTPAGGPLSLTVKACLDEAGFPLLARVCATRQLSSTTTTTATTGSTTSTTLTISGVVSPVLRNVFSSVTAGVVGDDGFEKLQSCCNDFLSPFDFALGPLTDDAEFPQPGASGSATVTVDPHTSTVTRDAAGRIVQITDKAAVEGELSTTNYVDVVVLGSTRFQYDFDVTQPIAYSVTASVAANAPIGRRRLCNAIVFLQGASFRMEEAAFTNEGDDYHPGGNRDDQQSGTLAPGRYSLVAQISLTAGTADELGSQTATVTASTEVTLTFTP
jgi:hypothetical protein